MGICPAGHNLRFLANLAPQEASTIAGPDWQNLLSKGILGSLAGLKVDKDPLFLDKSTNCRGDPKDRPGGHRNTSQGHTTFI